MSSKNLYTPLICLLLALAWPKPASAYLLGAQSESFSSNTSAFSKWRGVLNKLESHFERMEGQCDNNKNCKYNKWVSFYTGLKGKPLMTQLAEVNRYMNAHRYTTDIVNWGVQDYWETPYEFSIKNGDCEDYAISKYYTLKRMGLDTSDMRIVVLQDTNLGVLHSVLAVYDGGNVYILDNQIKRVVQDKILHHYIPIYSINEEGWWRHRG